MGLHTKLQKWLRDRHWPDNRGGEYAAPCHAQSHATGIIAPMSTTSAGDSGKAGRSGCLMLFFYHVETAQVLSLNGQ